MRTAVAITLIVCGVVVVAIPPLSDAWLSLQMTYILKQHFTSVEMGGRMEDLYRFGCLALGAGMIGVGTLTSFMPRGGDVPIAAAGRI